MTHSDPKAAASGPKRRLRECVEVWPNCYEGGYDPRCCRFPKSCSCDVYDWERVGEDDLEPAPKAAASDDIYKQNPDGSWSPAEPLGWLEEHNRWQRFWLWLLRRPHCSDEAHYDSL